MSALGRWAIEVEDLWVRRGGREVLREVALAMTPLLASGPLH